MALLADIRTFGDVAAEGDDSVLSYFLKTDAVDQISSGSRLVVLGRKGSGKTALVKYFSQSREGVITSSPSLRDYPWNLHSQRKNLGASEIESYVSSWRYLIAVEALSLLITQKGKKLGTDAQRAAHQFLTDNYGGTAPSLADILKPKQLKLSKASFSPSVMGNAVGGVEFETAKGGVAPEIDALTDVLLETAETICSQTGVSKLLLHFDELDQGMATLDEQKKQMIVGLVLASRSVRFSGAGMIIPVSYIRTDIWDELRFSDKNKISQSSATFLEWTSDTLLDMINERLKVKLGKGSTWHSIEDSSLMRGSQSKWSHIVSRTFLRPRDVIQFLNFALEKAVRELPDGELFDNSDI